MKQLLFEGVYEEQGNLYTIDLRTNNFRMWDPNRSKLAAAIKNSLKELPIKENSVVLYLGASYGNTSSHVSDIVGKQGFVFAIDFAPRVVRELVYLCEKRKNMAPILADANHPETYRDNVTKPDVIYQDIAQRNQAEIFIKNCRMFLKSDGYGLLAVKARSIDSIKNPQLIFEKVRKELEKQFTIIDYKELEPYEKDHCMFVVRTGIVKLSGQCCQAKF